MKILILFLFYFVGCWNSLDAQSPSIQWQRTIGGSDYDRGKSLCKNNEGGYYLLNFSESMDGDRSSPINIFGGADYWLINLDTSGSIVWDRSYGGTDFDDPSQIICTKDKGYAFCGTTSSNDSDVSGNHSFGDDIWITKLDSNLTIQWENCFGSSITDYGYSVTQTLDSQFVFLGDVYGNDSNVIGNHGDNDMWVVKVNHGVIRWQLCLGSTGPDFPGSILATADGGVVVTGATDANGSFGYCSSPPPGYNAWVVKIDSLGAIQWETCLGSSSWDEGVDIIEDARGGFFLVGTTQGNDYDVTHNYGYSDIWVLRLNSNGNILWQNSYGGENGEVSASIALTPDMGAVVCGYTTSYTGQAAGNHGATDAFLVKIDSSGNCQWSHCYGGSYFDQANAVMVDNDGSILFTGTTQSNDGDVTFNHGYEDVWIVKLDPSPVSVGEIENPISELTAVYENGKVNLRFNNFQFGNYTISVYDLLGKELYNSSVKFEAGLNKFSFELYVASGMKLVRIQNANSSITARIWIL